MILRCGSSDRHAAFKNRPVAAIMLSAMGVLYLYLNSAELFAISKSTFTILKSFPSKVVLKIAVSRPSRSARAVFRVDLHVGTRLSFNHLENHTSFLSLEEKRYISLMAF